MLFGGLARRVVWRVKCGCWLNNYNFKGSKNNGGQEVSGTCLKMQEKLRDEIEDEATEIFENIRVVLINTKEREKELEGIKKKSKKF